MHDSTRNAHTFKTVSSAPGSIQASPPRRILAIDLGKFKSVACGYDPATGVHTFTTLPTRPDAVHDLLAERAPDRLVIEVGSAAGWVKDLAEAMGIGVQVANPNHDAWRWKNVKRKTDQDDALKLAQLSAMNQLPTVQLPGAKVRQWRSLGSEKGIRKGDQKRWGSEKVSGTYFLLPGGHRSRWVASVSRGRTGAWVCYCSYGQSWLGAGRDKL